MSRPRKRCSPITLPVGVVALDADVVGVARPVHGRARVGLGHHQQRRRRLRARRAPRGGSAAKLADAVSSAALRATRPGRCRARAAAVARRRRADEVVLPVSEQQQMVLASHARNARAFRQSRPPAAGRRRRLELLRSPSSGAPPSASSRRPRPARRPARARCRPPASRAAAASTSRSTSICIQDSRGSSGASLRARIADISSPAGVALDGEDGMHDQVQRRALARLISIVVESTRNGMSSLTISMTECARRTRCRPRVGLTAPAPSAAPGHVDAKNCKCDSSAPYEFLWTRAR